jgi:DNA gyrase/topoisomerase IV subunit A
LINQISVGEWIREVTERPESAPLIIREIAQRLIELDKLNEKLRTENLELSTGLKVHQYKQKIAELEYQLEIMSRQLEHGLIANLDTLNLLLYTSQGRVIKLALTPSHLAPGATIAAFADESLSEAGEVRLLAANPTEELLFVFDTGRIVNLPVADLPLSEGPALDWAQAHREDLRSDRELVVVMPIGTMASFDQCIQTSRRGHARKIMKTFFQKYIAQGNVGKGIDPSTLNDAPLNLTLANAADVFVIVTRQGYALGLAADSLSIAVDRAIKLDPDDYVITSFILRPDQFLAAATQEGRVVRHPADWLKPAAKPGGRGQSIWPKSQVSTGLQVVGAIAAGEADWGVGLRQDGQLVAFKIGDIPLSGAGRTEHTLKNIYPFDLAAFTGLNFNS